MNKQPVQLEILSSVSRVRRSHQEARAAYNSLSRWYDLVAGSEKKFTRMAAEMLGIKPGESALDLGCGTGHGLTALAKTNRQKAQIFGCDISNGMLAKARSRLLRKGHTDHVNLLCADAAASPIQSACFDALLLSFTLELFDTPEIPGILGECRRILKPGGRLAVVALAKTASPGWMERAYEWFHAHYERLADCRPITAVEFLARAGFCDITCQRQSLWGLPIDIVLAKRNSSEKQ